MNDILKPLKSLQKNQLLVEKKLNSLFDIIQDLIIKDLKKTAKKGKTIEFANKLWKASHWNTIQSQVNINSKRVLKDIHKIFGKDIEILKKIYPETTWKESNILQTFRDVDSILKNYTSNVGEIITNYKVPFQIYGANLVADDIEGVISWVERTFKRTNLNASRDVNTSIRMVNNLLRQKFYKSVKQAKKEYIYIGPVDSRTRPFCKDNVSKVKSQKDWEKTINDEGTSVWVHKGGYNCRHTLLLIPSNYQEKDLNIIKKDFNIKYP